jgi:hypothetical protein
MTTDLRDLVSNAKIVEVPRTTGGRGRPPMYEPLIQLVLDKQPAAVEFGPFEGENRRRDAERVRTGCHSYVTDHPELTPEGKAIRFSVKRSTDGTTYSLFGWVEDKA